MCSRSAPSTDRSTSPAPRLHLGLTGGIGSGKSTVAAMFAARGAHLIDADAISRELLEPGSPVLAEVVEAFGPQILDEEGRADRAALAREIFGDDAARERLNAIIHPAVRERAQAQREAAAASGSGPGGVVVIEDIPLLAETGQADRFDGVIVVEAPEQLRLERLQQIRGMDPQDARRRMAAQSTDRQRRAIATWIIQNTGSLEETEAQVQGIWEEVGARLAES